MQNLTNQTFIVTGASKGIGKGIATVFANAGANLLLVARNKEALLATRGNLPNDADIFTADVTQEQAMNKMADFAVQRFGKIDGLIHNAGIYPEARLEDVSYQQWREVLATNLDSTFLSVKACLPQMQKNKFGRIIIISSITGPRVGQPLLVPYAASKAGVNGFIKSAAIGLAKYNITVNGIEPGNILTEGLMSMGRKHQAEMEKAIPISRLGTPEEIGYACLYLASKEAAFVTGQTIIADGGQTLPESHFQDY